MSHRAYALRVMRRIHGLNFNQFKWILGLEDLTPSQDDFWERRFGSLRKDFFSGYLSLDEDKQQALWAYAELMEDQ